MDSIQWLLNSHKSFINQGRTLSLQVTNLLNYSYDGNDKFLTFNDKFIKDLGKIDLNSSEFFNMFGFLEADTISPEEIKKIEKNIDVNICSTVVNKGGVMFVRCKSCQNVSLLDFNAKKFTCFYCSDKIQKSREVVNRNIIIKRKNEGIFHKKYEVFHSFLKFRNIRSLSNSFNVTKEGNIECIPVNGKKFLIDVNKLYIPLNDSDSKICEIDSCKESLPKNEVVKVDGNSTKNPSKKSLVESSALVEGELFNFIQKCKKLGVSFIITLNG